MDIQASAEAGALAKYEEVTGSGLHCCVVEAARPAALGARGGAVTGAGAASGDSI
jgi:hypothetical protein